MEFKNKDTDTKFYKFENIGKLVNSFLTCVSAIVTAAVATFAAITINNYIVQEQTQIVIEPREGDIIVQDGANVKLLQLINADDILVPEKIQEVRNKPDASANRVEINNINNIIKNEIDRILVLLQDFLLVNKTNMNCDIMDINMLIDEVTEKVMSLMDSNKIKFNIETSDDELFINGDYNRLCQVLINILKNSIEADAKNITLSLIEEDNKLLIDINDDGIGISKEIMENIYEPFYTTKRCGTGLGVSLSKEIINAHNGTIEYKSIEGSGTEVKIMLPSYNL